MLPREFCKKCSRCRSYSMAIATIPYQIQFDHDGRKYDVSIPDLSLPKCSQCGNIVFDEFANEQVSEAFRQQAGLLAPEQIKEGRVRLGYNQQEFAETLGVAVSTLCRWENGGQIQQRFHNDVMRAFFDVPEFREYLARIHGPARSASDGPVPPTPSLALQAGK